MSKVSHVHCGVQDLTAAVRWFQDVFHVSPSFQNDRIAWLRFDNFGVILDAAATDSVATLGFDSTNCDADFSLAAARGAKPIEVPQDRPWGARVAYLRGPGALTIEFEQFLRKDAPGGGQ